MIAVKAMAEKLCGSQEAANSVRSSSKRPAVTARGPRVDAKSLLVATPARKAIAGTT